VTARKPSASVAAASGIAAVMAAAALATPMVVQNEGWVLKTSPDPIGIPTACAGVTAGMRPGHVYTQRECMDLTATALVQHGMAIRPCLPEVLPNPTRAAFISLGYNVGPGAFCKSSVSRDALAGNLPAACADLSKFVFAGGHQLPGLVARRKQERAMCEAGLRDPAAVIPAVETLTPVKAEPSFFSRLMRRFA
jgi:lysozyme